MTSPDSPTSPRPTGDEAARSAARGRLLILAAALLWSTSGLFAKAPFFNSWPIEQRGLLLAFWRAVFVSLALAPLARRRQWTWRLAPMTLIFTAMNVTYLSAMTLTTAANAIWLQNTAPVWVLLVGVFVFGERARASDWLLLVFAMSGVAIILAGEITAASSQAGDLSGVTWGIAGGMTYAATVLSLRLLRDLDSIWLIAANHIVTALLLLPYVLYHGIWPQGVQWLVLAAFGVFQMGLPYVLFARGLKSLPGHEASGIVLVEPLLVPLWVFLAWGHTADYVAPAWWTFAGGGLILTGLLVRYAGGRRTGG